MKLIILSIALFAAAACKSGQGATNGDSALSDNRGDKAPAARPKSNEPCLNLNIATAEELIKLPGVGDVMASRIIDYRERHGRFRRPEEIIIIEGFSENKYRAIAGMICVE